MKGRNEKEQNWMENVVYSGGKREAKLAKAKRGVFRSAALTVLLLEFAAFAFRGGAPRLLMPASTMSVILCAAALAACPTLAEILFYAGGACIALGIGAAADFDP